MFHYPDHYTIYSSYISQINNTNLLNIDLKSHLSQFSHPKNKACSLEIIECTKLFSIVSLELLLYTVAIIHALYLTSQESIYLPQM